MKCQNWDHSDIDIQYFGSVNTNLSYRNQVTVADYQSFITKIYKKCSLYAEQQLPITRKIVFFPATLYTTPFRAVIM